MRRPGDYVHRLITGHWPRWAPNLQLYPNRSRPCRTCGHHTIFELSNNRKARP